MYVYGTGGNQVANINDISQNFAGYEGGGNTIGYDLNGNMTSMPDKGISTIKYNFMNLPNNMGINKNGNEDIIINTKYRADGAKLRKENVTNVTGINGYTTTVNVTDYLDGFQYFHSGNLTPITIELFSKRAMQPQAFSIDERKVPPPTKTPELQFFPTAEGFYDYTKDQYIYQYEDHLGNARVSFGKNTQSQTLEIVDENDYYPFGMNHLKTGNAYFGQGSYKNYKYNGKELQETGMYDYGARMYMADIGRWGVVDPLSEKGHNFSPYNYAINNPIRFIDPDGMWISITDGQNQYRYANGQAQQQVEGKWVAVENKALSQNVLAIIRGLNDISNGGDTGKDLVSYFDNDKHDVNIIYDKGNAGDAGINSSGDIKIDPKASAKTPTTNGLVDSPFFVSLGHELGHKRDENKFYPKGGWFDVSRGEIFASHIENMIRAENGLPLRTSYSTNPKVFGGLDVQTVLIDCVGSSFYYRSANTPFEYNGHNGSEGEDRANTARSVYGTAASSVLKGRYNYYDNVKRTKKK